MFWSFELAERGQFAVLWLAGTQTLKSIKNKDIVKTDLFQVCHQLIENESNLPLKTLSILVRGAVRVFLAKSQLFENDAKKAFQRIRQIDSNESDPTIMKIQAQPLEEQIRSINLLMPASIRRNLFSLDGGSTGASPGDSPTLSFSPSSPFNISRNSQSKSRSWSNTPSNTFLEWGNHFVFHKSSQQSSDSSDQSITPTEDSTRALLNHLKYLTQHRPSDSRDDSRDDSRTSHESHESHTLHPSEFAKGDSSPGRSPLDSSSSRHLSFTGISALDRTTSQSPSSSPSLQNMQSYDPFNLGSQDAFVEFNSEFILNQEPGGQNLRSMSPMDTLQTDSLLDMHRQEIENQSLENSKIDLSPSPGEISLSPSRSTSLSSFQQSPDVQQPPLSPHSDSSSTDNSLSYDQSGFFAPEIPDTFSFNYNQEPPSKISESAFFNQTQLKSIIQPQSMSHLVVSHPLFTKMKFSSKTSLAMLNRKPISVSQPIHDQKKLDSLFSNIERLANIPLVDESSSSDPSLTTTPRSSVSPPPQLGDLSPETLRHDDSAPTMSAIPIDMSESEVLRAGSDVPSPSTYMHQPSEMPISGFTPPIDFPMGIPNDPTDLVSVLQPDNIRLTPDDLVSVGSSRPSTPILTSSGSIGSDNSLPSMGSIASARSVRSFDHTPLHPTSEKVLRFFQESSARKATGQGIDDTPRMSPPAPPSFQDTMTLQSLFAKNVTPINKLVAAKTFFHILDLAAHDQIELYQSEPYGSIEITLKQVQQVQAVGGGFDDGFEPEFS